VQYLALLETEGVELVFADEAIDEIAQIAYKSTRVWKILERGGFTLLWRNCSRKSPSTLRISRTNHTDQQTVCSGHLADIIRDEDLSRYIL